MTDRFRVICSRDIWSAYINVTHDGYSYSTTRIDDVNQARAIRDVLNELIGESAPKIARLTEVTKQAVEAVQNVVDNSSGFIVDEVNFDFVNTFTRIFSAANVTDERDAVELAILVMAAIAEAFEPGGAM